MDDQRAEIVAKFESIISELVKKEVATALKPLQEKVSLQSGTISDLERSANEHSTGLTAHCFTPSRLHRHFPVSKTFVRMGSVFCVFNGYKRDPRPVYLQTVSQPRRWNLGSPIAQTIG
ncbi:unnamed protein product [Pleuronectes platessa]|uniref:Uncharacterized protein n=1 Tax=Pleuronectes platessa TaxID=8262 RepID=A0A9N7Z3U4_PLEPL|nr:unnamed protein product [Pleuronectes platessa]